LLFWFYVFILRIDMSENIGEVQTTQIEKPLPGAPLRMKPVEINGKYYDPLYPPKLSKDVNGREEYVGGQEIDKDTAYSMRFWSQNRPRGLRDVMRETIDNAAQTGSFSMFAGAVKGTNELDEASKEKLSAHRIIAKEMGYSIGGFKLNENAGTVVAPITKIQPK
jgi:hypothetical protein